MKIMKRLAAILLACMMVFGMTITVFAASSYTITINNEETGHTYGAFQIFAGDLHDGILSNVEWGTGVRAEINDDFIATHGLDGAAAVAEALEHHTLTTDQFLTVVLDHLSYMHTHSGEQEAGTYKIEVPAAGYYLVKDKDNSLTGDNQSYTDYILKVVEDVTVTPKTSKTTAEKKVYENVKPATDPYDGAAGKNYNDVADYNIGDTVPYAFYSTVPDMTYYTEFNYIFEDKMSAGLTFNPSSVSVQIGSKTLTDSQFNVITTGLTCGCTFHVEIPNVKPIANPGDAIRIDYTATLNENAEIGLEGNVNEMRLKYSNNPNDNDSYGTTIWDKVVVFTYELDVTKVDGDDKSKTLADAEFILYRDNHGTIEYLVVDANNKVAGWEDTKEDASALVSDSHGLFKVIGLDDGTYYLEETVAPDGYNLLPAAIKVQIIATTINDQAWLASENASAALTALAIKINDSEESAPGNLNTGIVATTVENNKGATLPETGGIGTTIFYVIGAVLVLGAGVVLITRKRMH